MRYNYAIPFDWVIRKCHYISKFFFLFSKVINKIEIFQIYFQKLPFYASYSLKIIFDFDISYICFFCFFFFLNVYSHSCIIYFPISSIKKKNSLNESLMCLY